MKKNLKNIEWVLMYMLSVSIYVCPYVWLCLPPTFTSGSYIRPVQFDIFGLDLPPENMAQVMLHLYLSKSCYVAPYIYLAWLMITSISIILNYLT